MTSHLTTIALPRDESCSGVVALAALMLATGLITLGVVYLETLTSRLDAEGRDWSRAQVRAIAESGLELGYQQLVDDPGYRGDFSRSLGTGSVEVTISGPSNAIDIRAIGSLESLSFTYESRAYTQTRLDTRTTAAIGSQVVVNDSTLAWGGELTYEDDLQINGSTVIGDTRVAGFPEITLDTTAFQAAAGQVFAGNAVLGPGVISGNVYCQGNATLVTPVTFEKTLVVMGDVDFLGILGAEFLAGKDDIALVVGQSLDARNLPRLILVGSAYVGNNASLRNINEVEGFGSLWVANSLILDQNTNATWFNQPEPIEANPMIRGLPTTTTVVQQWRRPNNDDDEDPQ